MGNGNAVLGNDTPPPPTTQTNCDRSLASRTNRQMPTALPQSCGAMSEQGAFGFTGNVSVPQKLVQLVGCRDPAAMAELATRARAVKR